MGCSTFYESAELWTASAKEQEIKAAATATVEAQKPAPKAAEIPAYVQKCIRYGQALNRQKQAQDKAKKAATAAAPEVVSADTLVLAEVKTADEQRACARAVLDYYRATQKANAGKAKTS